VHVAGEGRELLCLEHAVDGRGLLLEGRIGLGAAILEGLVGNVPLGCKWARCFLAHGAGDGSQGSRAREWHHRRRRLAVHFTYVVRSNRSLTLRDAVISLLV
jgi:hypothetical protein